MAARLRDAETEIHDGDRIQIGPVVCTLAIGHDKAPAGPVEKMIAGWLQGEGSVSHPYHGESQQTISFPTTGDLGSDHEPAEDRIKHEVIQDVLVITPRIERARRPRGNRAAPLPLPRTSSNNPCRARSC